jgi:hypothetical protein
MANNIKEGWGKVKEMLVDLCGERPRMNVFRVEILANAGVIGGEGKDLQTVSLSIACQAEIFSVVLVVVF